MLVGTSYIPGDIPPETLAELGIKVLRFPIWGDYTEYVSKLRPLGIEPLCVIDKTTYLTYSLEELYTSYPWVQYWQIGNEPDQPNSDSSWLLTKQEYHALVNEVRTAMPGKFLVGGGLASGDVEWLVDDKYLDAIAIHPYGQKPDNWGGDEEWGFGLVRDVIAAYRARYEKPIFITEFGGQIELFNTQNERAGYHAEMIKTFKALDIPVACQFALTDAVPGFGMLETETLYAFRSLAMSSSVSSPSSGA